MEMQCNQCGEKYNKIWNDDLPHYGQPDLCNNCRKETWFDLAEIGVPKKYSEVTFKDFITESDRLRSNGFTQDELKDIRKVKEIIQDRILDVSDGKSLRLVFYGKPGTGKTLLASASINEIMMNGQTAAFISANDLLYECMDIDKYLNKIEELSGKTLLVIDDFTNVPNTDFTKRVMHGVIDGTYSNKNSLIITTNLTTNPFKSLLSPGSLDRMNEGRGGGIFFSWESFRR